MLLHLPVAMAAAALFGAPAVVRPEVSLCAKRASSAADPTLQQWCRSDTAALLEAAQCGGRVTLHLCDEASIGDLAQEWASGSVAAAASQPVAVLRNVKAPLGRIALCVADVQRHAEAVTALLLELNTNVYGDPRDYPSILASLGALHGQLATLSETAEEAVDAGVDLSEEAERLGS